MIQTPTENCCQAPQLLKSPYNASVLPLLFSSPDPDPHPTLLSIYIFATSTLVPKPVHTAFQPPDHLL